MQMIPIVGSSNVGSVGYDEEAKELHVQFLNGGHYKYLQVPLTVYTALLAVKSAGESVGSFVAKNVKPKFAYQKVVK